MPIIVNKKFHYDPLHLQIKKNMSISEFTKLYFKTLGIDDSHLLLQAKRSSRGECRDQFATITNQCYLFVHCSNK